MSLSNSIQFYSRLKGVRAKVDTLSKIRQEGYDQASLERQAFQRDFFSKIEEGYSAVLKQVESRLPGLIYGFAKRVMCGIELDAEQTKQLIEKTISENAPKNEMLEVSISEGDFNKLSELDADFEKKHSSIKFEVSPELNAGDCLIKSRFGLIDATVDTKIKQLHENLV